MQSKALLLLTVFALALAGCTTTRKPASVVVGDSWPQFRGPNGDGLSDAKGLPTTWSETEHVKWKTPIHGRAWSSPVIWGDQIWMTTATEDGRQLFAVCVNKETGKIVIDEKLFDVANPQFAHKFNSYGSPTPVIEPGRVYVTFGSPGTACLDTKTGKVIWQRTDFVCNHFRGAGSSPILYGDLLIMNFDGSDHQFIVALDKNTGKTVWQTQRSIDHKDLDPDGKVHAEGDLRKAFSTPHVATFGGKPLLISSGAKAHYAYDPLTGKEIWRFEERAQHSASARPVIGHGMIYILTGFSKGQLLALKPEGQGDVTEKNLVWKLAKGAPNKPSPLLIGDLIYLINDAGIALCLNAKTGAEIWTERVGGNFSASPIAADGKIYFCNEEGKTIVVAPGREFKKLAENKLEDGFMASPAVVGKALFLRTKTALYRIEQ